MRYKFPDLALEFCSREDSQYKKIRDLHYVENKGAHAQQVHFLVWYKGALAGIISGGSAAYAVASRDSFFGITRANREKVLNGLVDNTVFRLVKNEPNLSTRVLSLWREVIPFVWEDLYGVTVFGFETFVVEENHRKGSLYKADNWTFVGETSGNAKSHESGLTEALTRKTVDPKLVFCKWRKGFSTPVESNYVSSWKGETPEEKHRAKTIAKRRGQPVARSSIFTTRTALEASALHHVRMFWRVQPRTLRLNSSILARKNRQDSHPEITPDRSGVRQGEPLK